MATVLTCLIWQVLVVLGVPIGMEILNVAILAPRARSQVLCCCCGLHVAAKSGIEVLLLLLLSDGDQPRQAATRAVLS